MPLWIFSALFAIAIFTTLISGLWLLLHLTAFSQTFAGKADMVPSPKPPRSSQRAVRTGLAIFGAGLLATLAMQILAITGQANAWIG